MKKISKTVWIVGAVAVVALIVLANSLFTVQENEFAVVTKFGKIETVYETAGLKFKIPFVEDVKKIPKATQLYDITESDVITSDKKSMIADDFVLWRVTDPTKFVQTLNASVPQARERVSVAVYNATKNTISAMTQEEVIAARGERLVDMITEESNSDLGGYGIVIEKAAIKGLDLPDDNKDAVYARMISERQNIAASYTAQGQAEAQLIRNETDKQVKILVSEAEKKAAVLEAEGEASYMKILQEAYNTKDKADFYNFMRSLDALKAALAGGEKTILLDKDSELVKILYGVGME